MNQKTIKTPSTSAENSKQERFSDWIELKSEIHHSGNVISVHQGEIWWAALGENVGVEINGKSHEFSRPVLIYKKLGKYGFLAIPLTSQPHEGSWYAHFIFKGKDQYAALAQIRSMSIFRLYRRMGELPASDYELIRKAFRRLYF